MTDTSLIGLVQESPSLSQEDKSLLLNALDALTPEERKTVQVTLSDEGEGENQIEAIYTDRKQSLFERYAQAFKAIKRWAFHEGEGAERENERKRLNTLLDSDA